MRLFCFGFGYTAAALADRLGSDPATSIAGTRTRAVGGDTDVRMTRFAGDGRTPEVLALLAGATHVLVSIPPDLEGDPTLRWFANDLAELRSLRWIGYLSTIGVYGDCGGAWIDETAPVCPGSERSFRRAVAEKAWGDFSRSSGKRVEIFRLPGIYGPGRSAIDALRQGTARRIVKPGQIFNRIHVDDIALTLHAAMLATALTHDLFNVCDDEPCPPQDVVAHAAELLGLPPPPELPFEQAVLSPMARSFYQECKRVRNDRIRQSLGVKLLYPTYREGLLAILRG